MRVPPRTILPLAELLPGDRSAVGGKAANLGQLLRGGFPVPDGFVVLAGASEDDLLAAAGALGDAPWAVRSSAAAEDLADASFAGQYETVLDVRGPDALLAAVRHVQASSGGGRVAEYLRGRGEVRERGMAVLVQTMLAPEAAGVALTANPLTGQPEEIVITAARGLGERVVSGEAIGDEWLVRGETAVLQRSVESAIDAAQALSIARLARRVEARFGVPQDVEWAIQHGKVYLLQARPMTALPEPADWTPPEQGYWLRNFRLGEWLPEPMTPLFEGWLLRQIEAGFRRGMRETTGTVIPFPSAVINGWYYTAAGPSPRTIPRTLLRALVETRGKVLSFLLNALVRVNTRPDISDRVLLGRLVRHWQDELLPRYRGVVAEAEAQVEAATERDLTALVDRIGSLAGEVFWSLAIVGGSAWKMEGALVRFLRNHLPAVIDGGAPVLLRGVPDALFTSGPHAVQSLDWYRPTAGELGWVRIEPDSALDARRKTLAVERESAEALCRSALADRPALLGRFNAILEVAQRYARVREEQAYWFTFGWPVLRRAALRLGEQARARGGIFSTEDVFFLSRAELEAPEDWRDQVTRRRAIWERQRRLLAPLAVGKPPRLLAAALAAIEPDRQAVAVSDGTVVGQGASPGRASGLVRVLEGPEDFDRFQAGEVLVARATAPAWTPLFGRAAAVVTDGGTLAAHASLVAREYGIPAVVGTGDATRRLRTGQAVVVDGTTGVVRVAGG